MKKAYSSPKLTIHGNVAALTQLFGDSNANDLLIIGSQTVNNTTGSGQLNVP